MYNNDSINNLLKLIENAHNNKKILEAIDNCEKLLKIIDDDNIKIIYAKNLFYANKFKKAFDIFELIFLKTKQKNIVSDLIQCAFKLDILDKFHNYCAIYINNINDSTNIVLYNALNIGLFKKSLIQILYFRHAYINNLDYLTSECKRFKLDELIDPWSCSISFQLSYHNMNNVFIFKYLSKTLRNICPELNFQNRQLIINNKIKVGFISYFFKNHSVSKDRRGIIKLLDRNIFDVYVIFINEIIDDMSKEISNSAIYIQLKMSLIEAYKTIIELNLDILVYCELGMCVFAYYLAHLKLAPIQINTWGHSDTSGIDTIDYFVSSKLYEITDAQKHYSEKLILNNGLCTYYFNPLKNIEILYKTSNILEHFKDNNIYLCPGSLYKFDVKMDHIINEIITNDIKAIVILLNDDIYKDRIEYRLKQTLGLNIKKICFMPQIGESKYFFSLLNTCHVILDTYPFGGCNTSLETLSIGKPVITMPGLFINGRFTYGFYIKMNFLDLIVDNINNYINIVIKLTNNTNYYKYICNEIKRKSYILYENIESVYEWNTMLQELYNNYFLDKI